MKLLQHVLKNNRDYKYLHDEQAIFVFTEFFFLKLRLRSYGSEVTAQLQESLSNLFMMLSILGC